MIDLFFQNTSLPAFATIQFRIKCTHYDKLKYTVHCAVYSKVYYTVHCHIHRSTSCWWNWLLCITFTLETVQYTVLCIELFIAMYKKLYSLHIKELIDIFHDSIHYTVKYHIQEEKAGGRKVFLRERRRKRCKPR